MGKPRRLRWRSGLAVGLMSCGLVGVMPVQAHSLPMLGPPVAVIVNVPPVFPPVVVGLPGRSGVHSRGEVTWSRTGRADVDVDIDRQHGQAAAR